MLSALLRNRALALLSRPVACSPRFLSTAKTTPRKEETIGEDSEATQDKNTAATQASPNELSKFKISESSLSSLRKMGIKELTQIQAMTYDPIVQGKNVLARARTGTGKTIAFVLPVVESMGKLKSQGELDNAPGQPTTLILSPTRELAKQITQVVHQLAPSFSVTALYGGVPYAAQERELRRKLDIVVGTPGRMIDQIERGSLDLSKVKYFVLDEADEMLRVGFQQDVELILKTVPRNRQTMLFSATVPSAIKRIIDRFMSGHVTIDLVGNEANKTAKTVTHMAIKAHISNRESVLGDILTMYDPERAIIFTNTKRDATELSMSPYLKMSASSLHGDIDQSQREITMQGFRDGKISCLIATNVAARGLDIPEVDLVVQYGLPDDTESYVHRSGRTGRAGREGTSIVIFTHRDESELANFERVCGIKFIRKPVPHYMKVLESAGNQAARLIGTVDSSVYSYFNQVAENLIQERGSHALAAALAMISGHTRVIPRSILSGRDGYVTIEVADPRPFTSNSHAISYLRKLTGPENEISIGDVGLTKDGFIAEVPQDAAAALIAQYPGKVKEPIDLPEIIASTPRLERGGFGGRSPTSGSRGSSSFDEGDSYRRDRPRGSSFEGRRDGGRDGGRDNRRDGGRSGSFGRSFDNPRSGYRGRNGSDSRSRF